MGAPIIWKGQDAQLLCPGDLLDKAGNPIGGGASSNAFGIAQPITGSSPTADTSADTLTYQSSDDSMEIQGDSTSDSLDFRVKRNINPSKRLELYDDFVSVVANATSPFCWLDSANSGILGSLSVATAGVLDANHPGVMQLRTNTSTSSAPSIVSYNSYLLGGGTFVNEWLVQLSALSDGTDTYTTRVGVHNGFSTTPTDGAWFEYTHGTNSGKWQCITSNNSTQSTADSGVAAASGSWIKFKVVVNAAGTSVDFYINGTKVATITTNIPTTRVTGVGAIIAKSAGTSDRKLYIDYCHLTYDFTSAR